MFTKYREYQVLYFPRNDVMDVRLCNVWISRIFNTGVVKKRISISHPCDTFHLWTLKYVHVRSHMYFLNRIICYEHCSKSPKV